MYFFAIFFYKGGQNPPSKIWSPLNFFSLPIFNPPVGTTGGFYIWKILSLCHSVRFFEKFEDIYLFKGDI